MITDDVRLAATAAAVSGDAGTLYRLVSDLMGGGVPFDAVLFDLLLTVEREVGERWQRGDYLVPEEHAATATIETVVSLLAGMFDQPPGAMGVVVAAAEGDQHSLPARMVAAYLLEQGFRTSFLGANVLAAEMAEYLAAEAPDALVLSCAMSSHLPGVRRVIRAAHSVGVPVVVGGRAFGGTGEWAGRVGADARVASPREIPDILRTWRPEPAVAEAGALDPSPALVELGRRRSAVLAAAERLVADGEADRAGPDLALLLEAVEASLLVEDDALIVEMLEWQESRRAARGDRSPPAAALQAALEDVAPTAAAALSRAMQSRT